MCPPGILEGEGRQINSKRRLRPSLSIGQVGVNILYDNCLVKAYTFTHIIAPQPLWLQWWWRCMC